MKTYSLAMKRPDYSVNAPAPEEKPMKDYYPSFYLSDLDSPMDLPDEGTAEIKFKVVSRTESTREGKTKCSYDIEISELTPTGKQATKKAKSADDEIEAGLAEAEAEKAETENETNEK